MLVWDFKVSIETPPNFTQVEVMLSALLLPEM